MNRLTDLAKTASEKDCEQMQNELESFRDTASISDDAQQRILSSVMKKAGFEMNEALRMTKGKYNRQNRTHTEKPEPVSVVRRGRHALAACIALAVIAATAGAVIFGGKLNIEPKKPQPQTSPVLSSAAETPVSSSSSEGGAEEAETTVPQVVGLPEEQAVTELEDAGYVLVRRERYAYAGEGNVSDTFPAGGTALPKGSEVIYYVCKGPAMYDDMDKEELCKVVDELADTVMEIHGETIDKYNAEHETKFSLERADEDFTMDYLRELGERYEALFDLTPEGMLDYIEKSFMTGTAEVPDVMGLTGEEAAAKLSAAGFVPYPDGIVSTYVAEGAVCWQTEYEGDIRDIGTPVGYSINGVDISVKNVPEYDGDSYEDDELSIKVNRFMCDGCCFYVGFSMESRTETHEELSDRYSAHVVLADTGEIIDEFVLPNTKTEIMGLNKIEMIQGYPVTPEMLEHGIKIDVFKMDEFDWEIDKPASESIKKGKKDRLLSIPLESNVPTKTLTAENGDSLTLSSIGVTVHSSMKAKELKEALDKVPYIIFINKDGSCFDGYEYNFDEGMSMCSRRVLHRFTDGGYSWCFYGNMDIENIEAVKVNGILFE